MRKFLYLIPVLLAGCLPNNDIVVKYIYPNGEAREASYYCGDDAQNFFSCIRGIDTNNLVSVTLSSKSFYSKGSR